jgi:hypothetical protein
MIPTSVDFREFSVITWGTLLPELSYVKDSSIRRKAEAHLPVCGEKRHYTVQNKQTTRRADCC